MYIDECGNPGLETSENPNHRFLSLTGIILELKYSAEILHPEIEELKKKYFQYHPDEPIIFHRKEMVNRINQYDVLKDPGIQKQFDCDLLEKLKNWDYTVISVCIDKKSHKDLYTTWRYDPYHYCLAVLIERFCFFLRQNNAVGDVMAESRGGKEDMRLKKSFNGLFETGTNYMSKEIIQNCLTSKELKVKPKQNNISGLQLADLIAHPSRDEILLEKGLITKVLAPFASEIIKILQDKYYSRKGIIKGSGRKMI
ncbi:MAG: DUF3800 domain-containing protein [bacterium]